MKLASRVVLALCALLFLEGRRGCTEFTGGAPPQDVAGSPAPEEPAP